MRCDAKAGWDAKALAPPVQRNRIYTMQKRKLPQRAQRAAPHSLDRDGVELVPELRDHAVEERHAPFPAPSWPPAAATLAPSTARRPAHAPAPPPPLPSRVAWLPQCS